MLRRRPLGLLVVVVAVVLLGRPAAAQETPEDCGPEPTEWATTYTDVGIRMRDGVCLRANLWLPDDPGRYPVVFAMTPYRKDDPRIGKPSLVDAGYVYALVDVRGIGASGGSYDNVFSPDEQADGAELAHWLAAPERLWNGGVHQKVGMIGHYLGITQWFTAAQPGVEADLGAIFPCKAYSDLYRDIVYHGGSLTALFVLEWGFGTGAWWTLPPAPWTEQGTSPEVVGDWLTHLQNEPVIVEALERPFDDGIFRERAVYPIAPEIDVPAYHCGGWYDGFLRGTLDTWRLIGARPGRQDRMVLGPWPHSGYEGFEITDERIAWFDHWLKGVDNGIAGVEKPISMFVMRGASQTEGEWRAEAEWPLARTQYTDWFLRSEGRLTAEAPTETESPETAPTVSPAGATLTAGRWSNVSGVTEFEQVDQRPDEAFATTYTTDAFATDVELTGPLVLHLWAAANATDADLFAKVSDVAPDGSSTYLTEGFLRLSHRAVEPPCTTPTATRCSLPHQPFHPHGGVEPVPQGEPVLYEIEIWPTANVFPAGHQLRLALHTGDLPNHYTPPNPGTIDYLHDPAHPSHLTVPVIPAAAAPAAAAPTAPPPGDTGTDPGGSTAATGPSGPLPATGGSPIVPALGLLLAAASLVGRRLVAQTKRPPST